MKLEGTRPTGPTAWLRLCCWLTDRQNYANDRHSYSPAHTRTYTQVYNDVFNELQSIIYIPTARCAGRAADVRPTLSRLARA